MNTLLIKKIILLVKIWGPFLLRALGDRLTCFYRVGPIYNPICPVMLKKIKKQLFIPIYFHAIGNNDIFYLSVFFTWKSIYPYYTIIFFWVIKKYYWELLSYKQCSLVRIISKGGWVVVSQGRHAQCFSLLHWKSRRRVYNLKTVTWFTPQPYHLKTFMNWR